MTRGSVVALALVLASGPAALASAPTVVEVPTPTQPSNPTGIVSAPDGALWFTESGANKIARVTTSGQFSEFPIPTSSSDPTQVAVGSDGAIWFTEFNGNKIGRIPTNATPGSGAQITEFPVPTGSSEPSGIAAGGDGALWFSEYGGNRIGRIPVNATPGSGAQITEFAIPTATSGPRAIAAGPDNALWFTEDSADQIGRIPTTATPAVPGITQFPLPTKGVLAQRITQGPDGAMWFTEAAGNKLGRIPTNATPGSSAQITERPTPGASPLGIVSAPVSSGGDGGVWIAQQGSETGARGIASYDVSSGTFASYAVPTGALPDSIALGQDRQIRFTDRGQSKIGLLSTSDAPLTATPADDLQEVVNQRFTERLASFTDADRGATVADFSATVDWGDHSSSPADGQTVTIVANASGGFDVIGTHIYKAKRSFSITVTILDRGGASTSAQLLASTLTTPGGGCTPGVDCPGGGGPGPPNTQCPTGSTGNFPYCTWPAPADCNTGVSVPGQNWTLQQLVTPPPNPNDPRTPVDYTHQTLTFGSLRLISLDDCWHYDGPPQVLIIGLGGLGGLGLAHDSALCLPPTCHVVPTAYGTFHARGRIFVNGIILNPEGSRLEVDTEGSIGADQSTPAGGPQSRDPVDVYTQDGRVRLGKVDVVANPILPSRTFLLHVDEPQRDAQLGGLPLTGGADLTIPSGGLSHLTTFVQLPPNDFRDGTGGAVSSRIDLDYGADTSVCFACANDVAGRTDRPRARAAQAQAIHLPPQTVWIGALEVDGAYFDYDPGANSWSGGGTIVLPLITLDAKPSDKYPDNGFFFSPNSFHAGATAEFNPPMLPLFTGVRLTHVQFSLGLHPTRFSGGFGVELAGGLATADGNALAVFATPNDPYDLNAAQLNGHSLTCGDPLTSTTFAIAADVHVLGFFDLGSAYAAYEAGGPCFEFGGSVRISVLDGAVEVDGGIQGGANLRTRAYDLEAFIHLHVLYVIDAGAEVIVSSSGIGGCVNGIGGGYTWGSDFPKLYFSGCDINHWYATLAAAGGPRTAVLPAGLPQSEFRVQSSHGSPSVTVTGPHGQTLSSGADPTQPVKSRLIEIIPYPSLNVTYVGLIHPAAGRWTIAPNPASVPITTIYRADGLPPAAVTARVTGRGRRLTLVYNIRPRPTQTVTFLERGRGVDHTLGVVHGGRGAIRFAPGMGPAGRREIVAQVTLDRIPDGNIIAGHYVAPGPPLAGRIAFVHASRRGSRLTVGWGASPNAVRYAISVAIDGGARISLARSGGARGLTINGVGTRAVTITVAGIGPLGEHGPNARVRLGGAARPARITGITITRRGRALLVRWHRAARATSYVLRLTVGRQRTNGTSTSPTVTLTGLRARTLVTLVLAGVGADHRVGPGTVKRFRAPR